MILTQAQRRIAQSILSDRIALLEAQLDVLNSVLSSLTPPSKPHVVKALKGEFEAKKKRKLSKKSLAAMKRNIRKGRAALALKHKAANGD